MADALSWPGRLSPRKATPTLVTMSRGNAPSLGGVVRSTRSDLGHWTVAYDGVPIRGTARARALNALRSYCGGRAGLLMVPVWSHESAPYVSGRFEAPTVLPHSDGSTFSDGSGYAQPAIVIKAAGAVAIGATSMSFRLIASADDIVGTRFSYEGALYEIGPASAINDDVWTCRVAPEVRAVIPDGADLEFDRPELLCRLDDDSALAAGSVFKGSDEISVTFREATDFWNDLAAGLL